MRPWHIVCAAVFVISLGCGGNAPLPGQGQKAAKEAPAGAPPAEDRAEPAGEPMEKADPAKAPAKKEPGAGDKGKAPGGAAVESAKRKIIYNGTVQLIVKDLDRAEADFKALLKEFGVIVANSEMTGSAGSPRSGHWRLRVPVDRFEEVRDEVVKLGVPQRNTTDSQDVSEEYYDLEDRIKNKRMELDTLRGYLQEKKATSRLDEILTIEKELSRVRGELDQLEGRLRRLKDLTALATLSVTLQEIKDYQPEPPATFGNSVRGTFTDSLDLLVRFGQGVVIVAVALGPWLAVLAVVAVPTWRIGRRYWKKAREVQTVLPVEEGPEE